MKLNTVLERAPLWFKSGKCVYLKSAPGRGKTTTISLVPKVLSQREGKNYGLVVINGPLLTPADSIGFGLPKHHDNGLAEMIFSMPFWFRTDEGKLLSEYDGGIVLVDEADKMDVDVKKCVGEAALSGRLGPHRLPPGWVIWMAGNRQSDRSGATKELDHLINRRMEIEVTDDMVSLLDWCAKNGVLPVTQAFINQNPSIVLSEGVPEKQGPWCTPRSLVQADEYLRVLSGGTDNIPADDTTVEEIGGMIGAGAAAQYFSFIRLEKEMPKYEQIVADPEKVKVPEKADAKMLVMYSLAHRVEKQDAAQVIKYISRMDKDFHVPFIKTAVTRHPTLVTNDAVSKWCQANAALVAALGRN
jgi:hypothetical protein